MGAGFEMAAVEGVGIVERRELRQAFAQTCPALGDDDAVVRVAGLVAHGAGESGAHLVRHRHGDCRAVISCEHS